MSKTAEQISRPASDDVQGPRPMSDVTANDLRIRYREAREAVHQAKVAALRAERARLAFEEACQTALWETNRPLEKWSVRIDDDGTVCFVERTPEEVAAMGRQG